MKYFLFFVTLLLTSLTQACPAFDYPTKNPDLDLTPDQARQFRLVQASIQLLFSEDSVEEAASIEHERIMREKCRIQEGHLLFESRIGSHDFNNDKYMTYFLSFPSEEKVQ